MSKLEWLLRIAGVVQLGILTASALVPGVLEWRSSLAGLPRLLRELIWVHGAFVVLVIAGFGLLSVCEASQLASGGELARAVCALVGLFWLARLVVQCVLFDAEPFLRTRLLRVGYHGLTVAFTYLSLVYGWAALAPH